MGVPSKNANASLITGRGMCAYIFFNQRGEEMETVLSEHIHYPPS